MKIVIVYDSVFGNTERIAQAIGAALEPQHIVEIHKVDQARAEQFAGADLVIVGSPTRAFRPTPALGNWLRTLPARSLTGIRVAAFDTRISPEDAPPILRFFVKLFGWAAAPIAKTLAARGGTPVGTAEGFYVVASEGPLKDGEEARAAAWAHGLVA